VLLEVAAHNFSEDAVTDAESDGYAAGLAIGPHHPDFSRNPATGIRARLTPRGRRRRPGCGARRGRGQPDSCLRQPNAKSGVWNLEDAILLIDEDPHVGRHAGEQFELGIRRGDDHVIGHHILYDLRGRAHLHDLALKGSAREGIYGEGHRLGHAHAADICLVDVRVHLHVRQILSDQEERRCLQARGHGLSHIHISRHHDTVHGRPDDRVIEVDLGLLKSGLVLHDLYLGGRQLSGGDIELGLGGLHG
jgi:hypothetical protein